MYLGENLIPCSNKTNNYETYTVNNSSISSFNQTSYFTSTDCKAEAQDSKLYSTINESINPNFLTVIHPFYCNAASNGTCLRKTNANLSTYCDNSYLCENWQNGIGCVDSTCTKIYAVRSNEACSSSVPCFPAYAVIQNDRFSLKCLDGVCLYQRVDLLSDVSGCDSKNCSTGASSGLIIGIVCAGVLVLAVNIYFGVRHLRKDRDRRSTAVRNRRPIPLNPIGKIKRSNTVDTLESPFQK